MEKPKFWVDIMKILSWLFIELIIGVYVILGAYWFKRHKKKKVQVERPKMNKPETVITPDKNYPIYEPEKSQSTTQLTIEPEKIEPEKIEPISLPNLKQEVIYSSKAHVFAIVIEPGGIYTDYDLGEYDELPPTFKHNSSKTKNREFETTKTKIFTRWGWFNRLKGYYLFYDLVKYPNGNQPIGLEEFKPDETISSEEVELYLHETIDYEAQEHLVPTPSKIGGGSKWWIFVILAFVIIAIVAFIKLKGG
jgi:hypothetical protein